jgi:hypothetical protein
LDDIDAVFADRGAMTVELRACCFARAEPNRRGQSMRKRVLAVCLPLLVLVAVTGCAKGKADDGKDVASVQGSAAPTATPSVSEIERGRQHAQCMRDHGVPEADPQINADGSVHTGGGYDKHTLDDNVLAKAIEACKQYQRVLSPDVLAKKVEGARQVAKCMREHGVEGYPDPDPNDLGKSLPDAVRDDPQYDSAKDICDTKQSSTPATEKG